MIRLDKYLSALARKSRKETRILLRKGEIFVNNVAMYDGGFQVQDGDVICIDDQELMVKETVMILIYKTAGFVCSDIDEGGHLSWKKLIEDCPYQAMLHVAGRLDQDTEGLLIATSNGKMLHRLISPKRKSPKTYYVESKNPLSSEDIEALASGVVLEDGYKTLEASCVLVSDYSCRLTIHEGKYHQVKRMLIALGNEVTYLKREQFGEWTLDGLEKGEWRYI